LLLTSSEATYARSYLDGRGVSHDSITLFRLGFAPNAERVRELAKLPTSHGRGKA